jgi:hypothetical protein
MVLRREAKVVHNRSATGTDWMTRTRRTNRIVLRDVDETPEPIPLVRRSCRPRR